MQPYLNGDCVYDFYIRALTLTFIYGSFDQVFHSSFQAFLTLGATLGTGLYYCNYVETCEFLQNSAALVSQG